MTAPLTLTPYQRGQLPRDCLFALWAAMDADGATDRVFHLTPTLAAPFPPRGDLVDFVRHFEPEPPKATVTLIVADPEGAIAGLFWFTDLVPGVRAAANVWYRRAYRGEPGRDASRRALAWGLEHLGVPAIWAYTPWPEAKRHAEAIGFETVATLPGYLVIDGAPRDYYVLRCRKEAADG